MLCSCYFAAARYSRVTGEDGSACDVCEQMRRRKLAKQGANKPLCEATKKRCRSRASSARAGSVARRRLIHSERIARKSSKKHSSSRGGYGSGKNMKNLQNEQNRNKLRNPKNIRAAARFSRCSHSQERPAACLKI